VVNIIEYWDVLAEYAGEKLGFYQILGADGTIEIRHKSILNTQLYVNMEKVFFCESTEEYTVKVASTIEESCKLVEVGFEFVTEMEGKKIFRKRK
jgi:hypothetical protein